MWIAIILGSSVALVFVGSYIKSKKGDFYDGEMTKDDDVNVEDL